MNIEERMTKMERSARVWRFACLGMAVLFAGGWAMQDDKLGVVRCSELRVVDPNSDSEFVLDFKEDNEGKSLASFVINPPSRDASDAFYLTVGDDGSLIRHQGTVLISTVNGIEGGLGKLQLREGFLYYKGDSGEILSAFGLDSDGVPMLEMYGPGDEKAVAITLTPSLENLGGDRTSGVVAVWDTEGNAPSTMLMPGM